MACQHIVQCPLVGYNPRLSNLHTVLRTRTSRNLTRTAFRIQAPRVAKPVGLGGLDRLARPGTPTQHWGMLQPEPCSPRALTEVHHAAVVWRPV